jgi:hypothetical protein
MSASEIARILPRIDEEGQLPKQRQRRPGMHDSRQIQTSQLPFLGSWVAVPAPPRLPQRQPIRVTCRLRAVAGGARLARRLP